MVRVSPYLDGYGDPPCWLGVPSLLALGTLLAALWPCNLGLRLYDHFYSHPYLRSCHLWALCPHGLGLLLWGKIPNQCLIPVLGHQNSWEFGYSHSVSQPSHPRKISLTTTRLTLGQKKFLLEKKFIPFRKKHMSMKNSSCSMLTHSFTWFSLNSHNHSLGKELILWPFSVSDKETEALEKSGYFPKLDPPGFTW